MPKDDEEVLDEILEMPDVEIGTVGEPDKPASYDEVDGTFGGETTPVELSDSEEKRIESIVTPPEVEEAEEVAAKEAAEAETTEEEIGDVEESPWDKGRQEHDQEVANLKKQIEELTAARDAPADDPAKDETAKNQLTTEEALFEVNARVEVGEELGPLPELPDVLPEPPEEPTDEFDEPAMAKYRADRKVYENLVRNSQNATVVRAREQANRDAIVAERVRNSWNLAAKEALADKALRIISQKHGEKYRNEMEDRVSKVFKDRGYSDQKYPEPDQTQDIYERVAFEMKVELVQSAPGKRPVADDDGLGGKAATQTLKGDGTLDGEAAILERLVSQGMTIPQAIAYVNKH